MNDEIVIFCVQHLVTLLTVFLCFNVGFEEI